MLRIDQEYFQMALQHVKDRFPVDSRTFHSDVRHAHCFEPVAHVQQIRGHGAKGAPLFGPLSVGVSTDGTDDHSLLVHIEASAPLIHNVHRSPPLQLQERHRAGNGMPSWVQILPYVLPKRERQTVVLAGIQDHTVGPARSTSFKPIFDVAAATLPFYPFSCAVVRLRRMAHCWETLLSRSVEPLESRNAGGSKFITV